MQLHGRFQLSGPDGGAISISSRRSRALLAMLAVADGGTRTRQWICSHLWHARATRQAQASLRRELSNLRPLLNLPGRAELLMTDNHSVALHLDHLVIDDADRDPHSARSAFLEDLVIPGEDGFERWRRDWVKRSGVARVSPSGAAASSNRPTLCLVVSADGEIGTRIASAAFVVAERLTRLRWLTLLSEPMVHLASQAADTPGQVAARLGADYLLICTASPKREMALQLHETGRGAEIWSACHAMPERLDPLAIGALAEAAVAALSVKIGLDQEMRALDRGPSHRLNSGEKVWRARWHMKRLTREDGAMARRLLEEAASETPDDPDVMIEMIALKAWEAWLRRADKETFRAIREEAEQVLQRDPLDARGHQLVGNCTMLSGDHREALPSFEQAVILNPSLAAAHGQIGSCHILAGQPTAAITYLDHALRLDPLNFGVFHQLGELALAQWLAGNSAGAVDAANAALHRRPAYHYARFLKAIGLIDQGREGEAIAAWRKIPHDARALLPPLLKWLPFSDGSANARLIAAFDRCNALGAVAAGNRD